MGTYIENIRFHPDLESGGTYIVTGFAGDVLKPLFETFPENIVELLSSLEDPAVIDDLFIFRNGVGCAQSVYSNGKGDIDWRTVNQLHKAESATIYLRACQKYVPSIKSTCLRMEEAFSSCRVFVNVFATPPNSVGLKPHLDPTEFFVLQLHGSKIWNFWRQPSLEELKGMTVEARTDFAASIASTTEKSFVADVRRGQVMYVPRFKIHAPATSVDFSVHLTVGIATPSMAAYYD